MDLHSALQKMDLSEKQAEVYLAILKTGKCSVTEAAARAGIKRTTCYDIINDLMTKKLVEQTYIGKRKAYTGADPQALVEAQEEKLQNARKMVPFLNAFYDEDVNKPTIGYYEGAEGIKRAELEILDSVKEQYFYFGGIKSLEGIVGSNFLEYHVKERIKRGIWSNALRLKSLETELDFMNAGELYLRRIRYIDVDFEDDFNEELLKDIVTLTITDTKIFISSSKSECYALVIESRELVALMKILWKSQWKFAQK